MNPFKIALRLVFNVWPDLSVQAPRRLDKINQLTDKKKSLTIDVYRVWEKEKNTIAAGYFNGVLFVYVLELPSPTGGKGEGIPPGANPVRITLSPKFGKNMPLVQNVPGRSGIRWHPGTDWRSTLGCLIPGFQFDQTKIKESTKAYDFVFDAINFAQEKNYPIIQNTINYRQQALLIALALFGLIFVLVLIAIFAIKTKRK
jgi:uncharacterized membrane protein